MPPRYQWDVSRRLYAPAQKKGPSPKSTTQGEKLMSPNVLAYLQRTGNPSGSNHIQLSHAFHLL